MNRSLVGVSSLDLNTTSSKRYLSFFCLRNKSIFQLFINHKVTDFLILIEDFKTQSEELKLLIDKVSKLLENLENSGYKKAAIVNFIKESGCNIKNTNEEWRDFLGQLTVDEEKIEKMRTIAQYLQNGEFYKLSRSIIFNEKIDIKAIFEYYNNTFLSLQNDIKLLEGNFFKINQDFVTLFNSYFRKYNNLILDNNQPVGNIMTSIANKHVDKNFGLAVKDFFNLKPKGNIVVERVIFSDQLIAAMKRNDARIHTQSGMYWGELSKLESGSAGFSNEQIKTLQSKLIFDKNFFLSIINDKSIGNFKMLARTTFLTNHNPGAVNDVNQFLVNNVTDNFDHSLVSQCKYLCYYLSEYRTKYLSLIEKITKLKSLYDSYLLDGQKTLQEELIANNWHSVEAEKSIGHMFSLSNSEELCQREARIENFETIKRTTLRLMFGQTIISNPGTVLQNFDIMESNLGFTSSLLSLLRFYKKINLTIADPTTGTKTNIDLFKNIINNLILLRSDEKQLLDLCNTSDGLANFFANNNKNQSNDVVFELLNSFDINGINAVEHLCTRQINLFNDEFEKFSNFRDNIKFLLSFQNLHDRLDNLCVTINGAYKDPNIEAVHLPPRDYIGLGKGFMQFLTDNVSNNNSTMFKNLYSFFITRANETISYNYIDNNRAITIEFTIV